MHRSKFGSVVAMDQFYQPGATDQSQLSIYRAFSVVWLHLICRSLSCHEKDTEGLIYNDYRKKRNLRLTKSHVTLKKL